MPNRNRVSRGIRPSTLARLLIAASLAPLQGGCSQEAPPENTAADMPTEGWARRFTVHGRPWAPESSIPTAPQKKPKMVIYERTLFPDPVTPTPLQEQAAEDLRQDCYRAAASHGWFEFDNGIADGYELMFRDEVHYVNEAFVLDDRVLDPDRPEFLMYYDSSRGKQLVGFMFYTTAPLARGPQIGGPLTVWHYHVWSKPMCLLKGLLAVGAANKGGACERGIPTHRSPEMLHVWLLDHPLGPFAVRMALAPDLLEALLKKRGW